MIHNSKYMDSIFMKNNSVLVLIIVSILSIIMLSCEKERVADNSLIDTNPSFIEEFDSVGNLPQKGWVFRNNSKPGGFEQWTQAFALFPAYSYFWNSFDYAAVYSGSGTGISNLSVWMITPSIPIKNGDSISFYTRGGAAFFPDRLQFRANFIDDNPNVGNDSNSVGNFTNLIFDINPNLLVSGPGSYPTTWTNYSYTVSGLLPTPKKGRFAFRYYVPDGAAGPNSYYIGVDKFEFISAK